MYWQAQSFAANLPVAAHSKVSVQIKYYKIKLNTQTQSQTNDQNTTHVIIENALPAVHLNTKCWDGKSLKVSYGLRATQCKSWW